MTDIPNTNPKPEVEETGVSDAIQDIDNLTISPSADKVAPTMTTSPVKPPAKLLDRDAARAAILGAKIRAEPAELFGVKVEIRDSTVEEMLDFQSNDDKKAAFVQTLISKVYVPGGDRLFEEGDFDSIMSMPFNDDLMNLQTKIMAFMGVTPTQADKSPPQE